MSQTVRKAIIPAAGLGTRFLPATKAQAKEMLPIVDKPTLQYIIEEAIAAEYKGKRNCQHKYRRRGANNFFLHTYLLSGKCKVI